MPFINNIRPYMSNCTERIAVIAQSREVAKRTASRSVRRGALALAERTADGLYIYALQENDLRAHLETGNELFRYGTLFRAVIDYENEARVEGQIVATNTLHAHWTALSQFNLPKKCTASTVQPEIGVQSISLEKLTNQQVIWTREAVQRAYESLCEKRGGLQYNSRS